MGFQNACECGHPLLETASLLASTTLHAGGRVWGVRRVLTGVQGVCSKCEGQIDGRMWQGNNAGFQNVLFFYHMPQKAMRMMKCRGRKTRNGN